MIKHEQITANLIARITTFYHFLRFLRWRVTKNKLLVSAAALTFTALLALAPLMTVGFSMLRAFPTFQGWDEQLSAFIFTNFVPAAGEVVQTYLREFTNKALHLTTIGSIFLLVTAIMTMATVEHTFNDIWCVHAPRRGFSAFIRYWAVLTMAPILLVLSLFVSSYVLSWSVLSDSNIKHYLVVSAPLVLEMFAFTLMYVSIPNTSVPLRHSLLGGLFAAALFEVSKKAFALYVAAVPTYQLLYGALASIPIFLLWVYLSWLVILLGAEIVHALSYDHSQRQRHGYDKFVLAFCWLGHLWRAQNNGEGLTLGRLLQLEAGDARRNLEQILMQLIDKKLVHQLASGEYVLIRDLNQLSLAELYHMLPWKLPTPSKVEHISKDLTSFWASIGRVDEAINLDMAKPLAAYYQHDN